MSEDTELHWTGPDLSKRSLNIARYGNFTSPKSKGSWWITNRVLPVSQANSGVTGFNLVYPLPDNVLGEPKHSKSGCWKGLTAGEKKTYYGGRLSMDRRYNRQISEVNQKKNRILYKENSILLYINKILGSNLNFSFNLEHIFLRLFIKFKFITIISIWYDKLSFRIF